MTFESAFDSIRRWTLPVALAVVAIAVVVAFAIMPVRIWLDQREALAETRQELAELEGQVHELEAQHSLLETDAEIERQARENFDLVYPGEESYRILPASD